jgi:hypothetical protein
MLIGHIGHASGQAKRRSVRDAARAARRPEMASQIHLPPPAPQPRPPNKARPAIWHFTRSATARRKTNAFTKKHASTF